MKRAYKIKTVSLLAFFMLIALPLVSSCGMIVLNTPSNTETTTIPQTTPISPDTETDPPDLPPPDDPTTIPAPQEWEIHKEGAESFLSKEVKLDFSGSSLFIVDSTGLLSAPLTENNDFSEALYERNRMVCEKYGMQINAYYADPATLFEDFKSTLASGQTFCDVLSIPISETGRYIASGLLMNQKTLPFFEPGGEYIPDTFRSSSAAAQNAYISIGYASLSPSDMTSLYFNRTILSNADIDLYELVRDGSFTVDKYLEIAATISASTLISESLRPELIALEWSESSFFTAGYGKSVSFNAKTVKDTAGAAGEKLAAMLFGNVAPTEETSVVSEFAKGKSAFMFGTLGMMEVVSEERVLWGILPMPKANENAKHVTPVSDSMAAFVIPHNNTKTELTSASLNALHAASHRWLLESAGLFYAKYYIPDLHSCDMIKIIIQNPVIDFSASAYTLSEKYDTVLFEAIRKAAADPKVDLSSILTTTALNSIRTDLRKYYK